MAANIIYEHTEARVIKNFLEEAKAHFEAEVACLKAEVPPGEEMTLSQKKAIEGARWTIYHTGTLLKYLETRGGK